ncbi:MAG TPA: hypothetical protein VGF94_25230 [Kofleriaceae bacterium]|jgi:hypothetical protein
MHVGIEVELAARCVRCLVLTPVDGIREQVPCIACATTVDVSGALGESAGGTSYLFDDKDVVLEALVGDAGAELFRTGSTDRAVLAMRRAEPSCRACAAALAPPAPGAAQVACACGARLAVRWPDASTRGWDLRLSCVVGESPLERPERAVSGLVIPCGGCGAPLSGTLNGRTITCEYCKQPNFLPESIWSHIAADTPAVPFYLLYELDGAALAKMLDRIDPTRPRWRKEPAKSRLAELRRQASAARLERALQGDGAIDLEMAKQLAARDLTAAEAKHVDNRLSNVDREKLVGQRIAQQLVDLWAQSSDVGTRAIAARVGNIARFVDDPEADVRAALAHRKHLPAAVIERYAKDSASQVRAAIAARHDCPIEILKQLRRDGDHHVAEAARANPAAPPGLLARLFGG